MLRIEYLKDGTIRPDTTAPGLSEARENLLYYNMSDGERRAYDEHLSDIMIQNDALDGARLEGRTEGLQEGLQQGRMEEKIRTVMTARKQGLPIATISVLTGLSIEEIEKL